MEVAKELAFTIASGPFSGLKLPSRSSWSLGDLPAKLVGLYEQELHPYVLKCVANAPDCIVNVGCADGYYAAAFGRLLPNAAIFGTDIDQKFESEFHETLSINGLKGHFLLDFKFSKAEAFEPFTRIIWIVDCEGYERNIPELEEEIRKKSDFLIECHECFVPNVTENLIDMLSKTHDICIARFSGRNPNDVQAFSHLDSFEKFLMVCEFRAETTQWIYAQARGSQ